MKKALLTKLTLLLCALIAGSLSSWATVVTKTMSEIATANNWVTASGSGTQTCYTSFNLDANITISTTGEANCGSYWGADWRLYQNKGGNVTVAVASGNVITSITFTYTISNTGTLKDGSTTVASGSEQSFAVNSNITSKTFTVGNTASATNGQVRITQISVTYVDPSDNRAETAITISGNEATGYAGEAYTTPTATLKAGSTTLNKTITWSSSATGVATIVPETGAITLVGAGTTTISASFAGDGDYLSSSANYTLTVYGSYTTLEQIHANVAGAEKDVKYTFANEYITYVSTDKKNIYISDGTRGMVIYNSTAYSSDKIVVGAGLSGSVKTKYKDYSGTVEFTSITNDDLAALINGSTSVTAQVKTIDAIAKANQSVLVKIENVTYDETAGTFSDGEHTIKYSKKFNSQDLTNNAVYDITGIIIEISNALNIAPRTSADITLQSSKTTPTSAWYTDNGKGTALSTKSINKADGNVSFFFDTNSTGAVTYQSSVTSVATINATTGEITPAGYGTTTITAYTAANNDYYESSASFTLTVTDDGVDILTAGFIGVTNSTYADWTDKRLATNTIYAGNSAKDYDAIQMRASTNNQAKSGIVTTTSGGRVNEITVIWNTNTAADRTIDIYGRNTAYTSAADLYGDNKGTKIGSIVKGTSTSLNITGNYSYIGIRSNSGALYLDNIAIVWDEDVRCVETGQYEWATFVSDQILDFENTGVKAYTVTGHSGNAITKSDALTKVPANTPLLLNAAEGTYAIPVAASASSVGTNLLQPGTGAAVSAEANKTKYVLSVKESNAAFKKINATNATVPTGKAYLEFDEVINAPFLDFYNETTSIDDVRSKMSDVRGEIYNLNGQRVAQPTKGLYIVNGKKYIFK